MLNGDNGISVCLSLAQVLVLVNGSPTRPFHMEWSVRQGEPFSPFLFDNVVEGSK